MPNEDGYGLATTKVGVDPSWIFKWNGVLVISDATPICTTHDEEKLQILSATIGARLYYERK